MPQEKSQKTCRYAINAGVRADGTARIYGCSHPKLTELFLPLIEIQRDDKKTLAVILCNNNGYNLESSEIQRELDTCRTCIFYSDKNKP